jgi:acyl carrier protein
MQSREEVEKTVNEIFVDVFEVEPEKTRADTGLKDLGLDSLDAVDLVVALEKTFGLRIPEGEARKIRTIGDIYENVEKGLAARKTP